MVLGSYVHGDLWRNIPVPVRIDERPYMAQR